VPSMQRKTSYRLKNETGKLRHMWLEEKPLDPNALFKQGAANEPV